MPRFFLINVIFLLLISGVLVLEGGTPQPTPENSEATNIEKEEQNVHTLKQDVPIEREISGGENHFYEIQLDSDEFLRIVIEQQSIDIEAILTTPGNNQLIKFDSRWLGPERISIMTIAEESGNYQLEIQPKQKEAATGHYRVYVGELRPAVAQDTNYVEAEKVFMEGKKLYEEGTAESLQKAMGKYIEAGVLWQKVTDSEREALALSAIGEIYLLFGQIGKAREYLDRALPLHRVAGDKQMEASTINNIGYAHKFLGEPQEALKQLDIALAISRSIGDRTGEATALTNIGAVYDDLGKSRESLNYYLQSLPLWKASGDRQMKAIVYNNIGDAYIALGERRKARDYFTETLQILEELGDQHRQAIVLANLGVIYENLGEPYKALNHHRQALQLNQIAGDRSLEAAVLNNIGYAYKYLGEPQKAMKSFEQALTIFRELGERREEASALKNIGTIFADLGEPGRALDLYSQALAIWNEVEDYNGQAIVLNNIGDAYERLEDNNKALYYYSQALQISKDIEYREGEASILTNIGELYYRLKDFLKALEYLNEALIIWQAIEDPHGEAITLGSTGEVHFSLGNNREALNYFDHTLRLTRAVDDRYVEANMLYAIARVERNQDNLNAAYAQMEEALKIVESLRAKVISPELRTSYFASVQELYKFQVDLLMELHQRHPSGGYDTAALQIHERALARNLLEILTEARADIRQGVDSTLIDRERILQQHLNAKQRYHLQLLKEKNNETELAASEKEIDSLLTEYQTVQTSIRLSSPRYWELVQPQPLSAEKIQRLLDEETILLEYTLGDTRSFLWAVTPDVIGNYELPKQAVIDSLALLAYQLLTARNKTIDDEIPSQKQKRIAKADKQYYETATALCQVLLGPVKGQLSRKRLLIVSEGILQYIPFAALPLPRDEPAEPSGKELPLITQHEIVNLPSASVLAVLRGKSVNPKVISKKVALLADPVFSINDPRVQRGKKVAGEKDEHEQEGLNNDPYLIQQSIEQAERAVGIRGPENSIPRLPFTRREAKKILSLLPEGECMEALDFKASLATAKSTEIGDYQIVHFATHGILNNERPELSGVILSLVDEQGEPLDGFLQLPEIYNLNLQAETVVLSGCQTALGEQIKGEGIVGITRGFMYAGAKRVVASLWKVDDEATAELIYHFYKAMLGKQRLRPASALREAQIEMLNQKRWNSPYYWAVFTVQGEW